MNRTTIDWPGLTHTWNPITGCRRGCTYCYARRFWNHWHRKRYKAEYDQIILHEKRFREWPPKAANRVFVGDMSDLQYWRMDWLRRVLEYCAAFPRVEFMFLTKSPAAYLSIYENGIRWPANTMQGVTVERFDNVYTSASLAHCAKWCPRLFVSWEPMLGPAARPFPPQVELVIIGAMTGPGAVPVKPKWIDSAREYVDRDKLYLKNSITKGAGHGKRTD